MQVFPLYFSLSHFIVITDGKILVFCNEFLTYLMLLILSVLFVCKYANFKYYHKFCLGFWELR